MGKIYVIKDVAGNTLCEDRNCNLKFCYNEDKGQAVTFSSKEGAQYFIDNITEDQFPFGCCEEGEFENEKTLWEIEEN